MVDRPWKIYGPFEMDRNDEKSWPALFSEKASAVPGITGARGVYVIGTVGKVGNHIRYVGMTGRQTFASEMFTLHKMKQVWNELEAGRPRIIKVWLFAKKTAKGRTFTNDKRLEKQAYLLEILLIMHARAAGHPLVNIKKMRSAIGMSVDGIFGQQGQGRKPKAATDFSEILGFV